jgi:hypothetical protein
METLHEAPMPGQSTDVLQVVEVPNHDTLWQRVNSMDQKMFVFVVFIKDLQFLRNPKINLMSLKHTIPKW